MRVLLDACVPKGLRKSLPGHEVRTAPEMGWGDLDNGDLLDAMEDRFDALVTVDKRLPNQQHITGRPLGIVVLRAKSNRLPDLLPLVPDLLVALSDLEAGAVREVAGH
jgi:predicted nuclease of predicted toxin-antitoxin system